MSAKFSVQVEAPCCPACGALEWQSGYWPPPLDLQLFRCEGCKIVFGYDTPLLALHPATEPVNV